MGYPERKRKLAPLSRTAGERLGQLIERTGLSEREFAAEVGLHDTDLNLLVHGKRTATGEKLLAIRDGLNRRIPGLRITVDELLEPVTEATTGEAPAAGAQYPLPRPTTGGIAVREAPAGAPGLDDWMRALAAAEPARWSSVWYRVYFWGMRTDPRRPAEAPRSAFVERPVPLGEETERIGPNGFGLLLNDASLSNWEGAEGQPLGRGWVVWCNPDARAGVQDGDLVVAAELHAGARGRRLPGYRRRRVPGDR